MHSFGTFAEYHTVELKQEHADIDKEQSAIGYDFIYDFELRDK